MKYAHLEKDTNKILGWYDEEINPEIPTPNTEVTDEAWQEALEKNANCYENGKFITKDFRTPEEVQEQELQIKINEALKYLSDTDFYYPRYLETGEPVPTNVVIKRQEYREFLRENENVK